MKKIGAAISSLAALITSWYTLVQLHVIPSFYIGRLNSIDIVVVLVAVVVTFLFTIYWLYWAFMSMIGAIFKVKVSLLDPLYAIWLIILKR